MNVQAGFVAALVDEWERAGLRDAVVAPGSRSTPLALGLARSSMRVHVVLDERAAGFTALGLGMASGRPAPVLTTSGTAPAHLLPAVIEAHLARVPMIVCSADRPPELHQVGAPQTVEQESLYAGFTRWRLLAGAVGDLPESAWRSIGARSVAEAVSARSGPGPVHLNLGFRDPLVTPAAAVVAGRSDGGPWHASVNGLTDVGALPFGSGQPGVIVAGGGITEPGAVVDVAAALGWPVLADPRSGCRGRSGAVVVSAFDAILRSPQWADALRPAAVLRLGAPPASKVLATWLAGVETHMIADPYGAWADPERSAGIVVGAGPEAVCHGIRRAGPAPAPPGWASLWERAESIAQDTLTVVCDGTTEPGVARALTSALGEAHTLVVASSMPVRDVEWFGDPAMRCRVLANRGANGIDGLISTAIGVSLSGARTVALLGDLAFLHDAGGLLWAAQRELDCAIVVVDNDGGGIFSFLPQATSLAAGEFERLFGTPHGLALESIAGAYGVPVVGSVDEALAASGLRVVIVRSSRPSNVADHERINAAVVDALGAP